MSGADTLVTLVARWRERADLLASHGAAEAASTTRHLAQELEAALSTVDDPLLTLTQAAEHSGFHRESLARLIRQGKLRNYGGPRHPLLRTSDLPRKPQRPSLTMSSRRVVSGRQ